MHKLPASAAPPSRPISRGSSSIGRCRNSFCRTPLRPAVRACRNRWRKPRHRNTRQNSTPRSSISRMAHSPHSRPRAAPRSANWARPSLRSRKNTTCRQASRAQMKSSWAGGMGYTQFMPKDFENYAVDGDGDGKRDIWNSIADALASTANSLKSQGWNGAKSWGYEVKLPQGFDCTLQGPDKARPISEWMKLGVARVRNQAFPQGALADSTFLVLPAGLKGPAFLATDNFSVLKLYNNSDVYAIFVGHVADMIVSNAPAKFDGIWQPLDRLPRDRIQRFQGVLVAQGHDVGKVDGLAGFKTRAAIG